MHPYETAKTTHINISSAKIFENTNNCPARVGPERDSEAGPVEARVVAESAAALGAGRPHCRLDITAG